MSKKLETVNPTEISSHFESKNVEEKWQKVWLEKNYFSYDSKKSREETFVVDTPPPTVSGSLHVGHVFSYTQTDVITRYQRMNGKNIFYPMGWDDNGLPTERRVQNIFHVRCEPQVPYDPSFQGKRVGDQKPKDPPQVISRQNFIELCEIITAEDEKAFQGLFQHVGLSVDWSLEYSTINDHCRKIAQLSFLDLFKKNKAYLLEAPTMWDVDFQTAVAQAELEDRTIPGAYHDLKFQVQDSEESFVISTTRPELLPACIGVAAHPDDKRFKHLFGKKAITPLFSAPVPIFPTDKADPEKGTGILMVCTFGDSTDVEWWREQKLPLKQIIGRDGKLLPVQFGEGPFDSLDPKKANEFYSTLEGQYVKKAQKTIVEMLKTENVLQGEPKPIQHPVKFYEKGDRPLEFVSTRQWFVRLMDQKQNLLKKGEEIKWFPGFMRSRFSNWTENLGLDWCVSRQRYFGVSIPVWYPVSEAGVVQYEKPLLPKASDLPIDPMSNAPLGYQESQRGKPGGFVGDPDVFDTWFTSSMTPQIGSHWGTNSERHEKLFPADIRPQSHEIIRTWAFYTIAKAMLHENKIPWKNVLISGWILDPDRKKMSKSKGNVVTPMHLLEEFSADAVRYWASSARLGVDTAFDDQVFKVGKRLVTKIFNASKFVLSQECEEGKISEELDLALIEELRKLIQSSTKHFESFDYAGSLQETESFFWKNFTDTYMEMIKARVWNATEGKPSAVAALRLTLSQLLKLFSPSLPYVTEEVWSWVFAKEKNEPSIHKTTWPKASEFDSIPKPNHERSFSVAVEAFQSINKRKTELGGSSGRGIRNVVFEAHSETLKVFDLVKSDLLSSCKIESYETNSNDELPIDEFHARDGELLEKVQKS